MSSLLKKRNGNYNRYFSVTKATLESQMSVCPSVCLSVCQSEIKTPQPLKIKPICHYTYLLISQMLISNHANQLSSQSATMPPHLAIPRLFLFVSATIMPIGHYIYWLSALLSWLLSHFGLFLFNQKRHQSQNKYNPVTYKMPLWSLELLCCDKKRIRSNSQYCSNIFCFTIAQCTLLRTFKFMFLLWYLSDQSGPSGILIIMQIFTKL